MVESMREEGVVIGLIFFFNLKDYWLDWNTVHKGSVVTETIKSISSPNKSSSLAMWAQKIHFSYLESYL